MQTCSRPDEFRELSGRYFLWSISLFVCFGCRLVHLSVAEEHLLFDVFFESWVELFVAFLISLSIGLLIMTSWLAVEEHALRSYESIPADDSVLEEHRMPLSILYSSQCFSKVGLYYEDLSLPNFFSRMPWKFSNAH